MCDQVPHPFGALHEGSASVFLNPEISKAETSRNAWEQEGIEESTKMSMWWG